MGLDPNQKFRSFLLSNEVFGSLENSWEVEVIYVVSGDHIGILFFTNLQIGFRMSSISFP